MLTNGVGERLALSEGPGVDAARVVGAVTGGPRDNAPQVTAVAIQGKDFTVAAPSPPLTTRPGVPGSSRRPPGARGRLDGTEAGPRADGRPEDQWAQVSGRPLSHAGSGR